MSRKPRESEATEGRGIMCERLRLVIGGAAAPGPRRTIHIGRWQGRVTTAPIAASIVFRLVGPLRAAAQLRYVPLHHLCS
jgi:hypothetical protein